MRYRRERIGRLRGMRSRGVALALAVTVALWIEASSAKAAPILTVAPAGLSFVTVEGGSIPATQSLTITTSGSEAVSWVAASTASWLQVIPPTGTTPSAAFISANVAGMTAGTYTGMILFTSTQTGTSRVVSVSVTVTPQALQSPQ